MVDFVDLADTSRWLLERALKGGQEESDDFVNLEMDTANTGSSSSGSGSGSGGSNDGILYSLYDTEDSSMYTSTATRPLLSKSAEAELYLLATNFLLYVAMVIITTLVAKIYFPQSLERGSVPTIRRKYSYRRQQMQQQPASEDSLEYADEEEDEMEALYSDDDDDDDVDVDDELGSPSSSSPSASPTRGGRRDVRRRSGGFGSSSSFHHSPHRDPLGLATTNDEDDTILDDEDDPFLSDIPTRGGPHSKVLEFDQERTSRTVVIRRLLFCSLMLNLTFVSWGLLQERMLTRKYPRHTGEYFTYSYALVFTNRFWTLCFSALLLFYLKPRLSRSTVIYEYSFPSISNMLSSWCQYEALRYVSFPATTLFKSFKLAPVMLMGKILGNKTCTFLFLSLVLYALVIS